MKRVLLALGVLVSSTTLGNCTCDTVVREESVYRTELDFLEQSSKQPSDLLAEWVTFNCKCDPAGAVFLDAKCEKSAKLVQVIRARIPWHKAMMLYNARLLDKRPPKDPPVIPPASDLCPKGN